VLRSYISVVHGNYSLGSALNFNATTAGIFRQCGIYDELVAMSKHTLSIQVGNEDREIDFIMDFRRQKEL
jgi:hypothetical protein